MAPEEEGDAKGLLRLHFWAGWGMWIACGSAGKDSACNAGDLGSIPGLGRSPEEGKGYPFRYSGLENSMDCMTHGVAKSQTRLSNFHLGDAGVGCRCVCPSPAARWLQGVVGVRSGCQPGGETSLGFCFLACATPA